MPSWILLLIARWTSGERFRKATPAERRWYTGALVFAPIFLLCFLRFGESLLQKAGAVGIWFFAMGCLLILGVCHELWSSYIPVVVSVIIGVIVWLVLFWLALTDRFFE